MGAAYNILGKMVPPHYLAIGTLTAVVGGISLNSALSSSEAAPADAAAPAPAKSEEFDVEKAINDFLSSTEEKKEA